MMKPLTVGTYFLCHKHFYKKKIFSSVASEVIRILRSFQLVPPRMNTFPCRND